MTTMQDKITAAIEAAITGAGAGCVVQADCANRGTIYAQYGFDTHLRITYQFNPRYCTLALSGPGVDAGLPDHLPRCHVERSDAGTRVELPYLQYTEGARIRTMVAMVTTMARRDGRLTDEQITRLIAAYHRVVKANKAERIVSGIDDDAGFEATVSDAEIVDEVLEHGCNEGIIPAGTGLDRDADSYRRLTHAVTAYRSDLRRQHLSVDYGNLSAYLADIGAAVTALGYTAKVEGLGGNTIGLVVTAANATWLLTWDETGSWVMSEDPALTDHVARTPDTETAGAVASWADGIMGSDTGCDEPVTGLPEVLAEEASKIAPRYGYATTTATVIVRVDLRTNRVNEVRVLGEIGGHEEDLLEVVGVAGNEDLSVTELATVEHLVGEFGARQNLFPATIWEQS